MRHPLPSFLHPYRPGTFLPLLAALREVESAQEPPHLRHNKPICRSLAPYPFLATPPFERVPSCPAFFFFSSTSYILPRFLERASTCYFCLLFIFFYFFLFRAAKRSRCGLLSLRSATQIRMLDRRAYFSNLDLLPFFVSDKAFPTPSLPPFF